MTVEPWFISILALLKNSLDDLSAFLTHQRGGVNLKDVHVLPRSCSGTHDLWGAKRSQLLLGI
jgi:hypothetical protein